MEHVPVCIEVHVKSYFTRTADVIAWSIAEGVIHALENAGATIPKQLLATVDKRGLRNFIVALSLPLNEESDVIEQFSLRTGEMLDELIAERGRIVQSVSMTPPIKALPSRQPLDTFDIIGLLAHTGGLDSQSSEKVPQEGS